jgi:hypothetical protein
MEERLHGHINGIGFPPSVYEVIECEYFMIAVSQHHDTALRGGSESSQQLTPNLISPMGCRRRQTWGQNSLLTFVPIL